jgi:hypothetical protein
MSQRGREPGWHSQSSWSGHWHAGWTANEQWHDEPGQSSNQLCREQRERKAAVEGAQDWKELRSWERQGWITRDKAIHRRHVQQLVEEHFVAENSAATAEIRQQIQGQLTWEIRRQVQEQLAPGLQEQLAEAASPGYP